MSAISNIGSSGRAWQAQRPDVAKMSEDLFAKLDTDGQGSIDETEFASALTQIGGADSTAAEMVKGLDADADSKVTKEELSAGMQQLADQFEAQFNASRTTHEHKGPPPVSPEDAFGAIDTDGGGGIDKAELQTALAETEGADSADEIFAALDIDGDEVISQDELAQGMREVSEPGAAGKGGQAQAAAMPPAGGGGAAAASGATQYDAADSNEDGTVTIEERLAYATEQAAKRPESAHGGDDAALDKLLAQLAKTYGAESTQENAVSVTA